MCSVFSYAKLRRAALMTYLKALVLAPLLFSSSLFAQDFEPPAAELEQWDWVQLTSGEWLKGRIIVLYDESLEFDSDILDELLLDWEDIQQVRSSKDMKVRTLGQIDKRGKLNINGDTVTIGDSSFSRSNLVTITTGEELERNYWSIQYLLGANVRSGNTEQMDVNSNLKLQRRTVANRFVLSHLMNFSENTDKTTDVTTSTAKDQRGNISWDHFLSDRFFLRPVFGEYQKDDFQNIDYKYTVGTGLGYQLFDHSWFEWRVTGGPAYQETGYITVLPDEDQEENTAAFVGTSNIDIDITSDLEFYHDYTFYFVNEASGSYLHHMVVGLNMDITSLLDFDVSVVWDRTEKPKRDENGYLPEKDDYRLVVSFGIDY